MCRGLPIKRWVCEPIFETIFNERTLFKAPRRRIEPVCNDRRNPVDLS